MGRWIAFDEESTAIAATQSGMAVSFQRGDALDTALATSKPAVVLMPGESSEQVLVLELRPNPEPQRTTTDPPKSSPNRATADHRQTDEPVAYAAAGFLGLRDEPVFGDDEPVPKKKWWQRLLD